MEKYISVGFVRRVQGIKGEVRISALMDKPNDFKKLKSLLVEGETEERKVERVFQVSDGFGLKLEGISLVSDAEKIKSKKLYAKREDIDKLKNDKDIYIEDILNKLAVLDNGEELGEIFDVQNFGANDIIYINSEKYKNLCFANIGGIITKVNEDKVILNKQEFDKVSVCD